MTKNFFIEDLLPEFCRINSMHGFIKIHNEFRTLINFQNILDNNENLTQNQANLLVKILKKYQSVAEHHNLSCKDYLDNPQWKRPFRILDLTRKIFLKHQENNELIICLKFPFALKESFDLEFPSRSNDYVISTWDVEEKIRKIPFDHINIVHLHDWAKQNHFEFSEDFLSLVNLVENFWNIEEKISPHSVIFDNFVVLINSTQDADEYFEKNRSGNIEQDLFLAKSMNFPLKLNTKPKTTIEKICAVEKNIFWIKEIEKFFQLCEKIQGKICVLIDRASERETWLKKFVEIAEKYPTERESIRVCFRDDKHDRGNFNQWVKDNRLGGSVNSGKYLIFENKPAKWLFKDNVDVKIIVTNNLYSNSNAWVNDWLASHPCVIHLSDVRPILKREKNIDSL